MWLSEEIMGAAIIYRILDFKINNIIIRYQRLALLFAAKTFIMGRASKPIRSLCILSLWAHVLSMMFVELNPLTISEFVFVRPLLSVFKSARPSAR